MLHLNNDLLLKNAFEHAPIGMAIVSLDGRWLKVNPTMSKITGYTEYELLSMNYKDITFCEDLPMNVFYSEQLRDGQMESFEYEKRYKHRNGKIVWVQLTSSIIRNENGDPLYFIAQIQDITERKRTEEQLKNSEERLRVIFEKAGMGIAIRDQNKRPIEINPMFLEILGYSKEDFLQMSFADLSHPEDIDRENELIQELVAGKRDYYSMEKRYLRKDKNWRWTYLTVCLFPSETEGPDHLLATIVDITERKNAEQKLIDANHQLQQLSSIDGLTGIANRRFFDEYLVKEWHNGLRHRSPLSIILFDIDYFKLYNDTYGHLSGDDCLKAVADTVAKRIKRQSDLFARYGGEEFAVILPVTDIDGATQVAHQIHEQIGALEIPHKSSKVSDYISISVGVATLIPTEGYHLKQLIDMADQALYDAKNLGRNRVAKYIKTLNIEESKIKGE